MNTRPTSRGFTLLEVVIAITIMAFLSLFTVQAIQSALKTKAKVQKDIDKNSTLRDALRVMERDINMAFNYRDPYIALYNQTQKERKKRDETPAPNTNPGSNPNPNPSLPNPAPAPGTPATQVDPNKYKEKVEKIYTQFIGEAESVDFTTLSNVRLSEDSKISSQAEVGYKIKSCRRRSTQEQSSKCLWRRVSDYLHEDITKHGESTVLLENVTEFKLRYLGPGKEQEWRDQWITSERGDDATKSKFPLAVEITIEMRDPDPKARDKVLRMTAVAPIRNPNNPKPATDGGANGANPATTTTTPGSTTGP